MSSQPPGPPDRSRRSPADPPPWQGGHQGYEQPYRPDEPYHQAGPVPSAPEPGEASGARERLHHDGAGSRGGGAGRKAAAAAGLLAIAAVGAGGGYWLGDRGDGGTVRTATAGAGTPAAASSATPSPSATPKPTGPRKQPLSGVAEVAAADARAQVRQAGFPVQGRGVEAWGWTDTNGRNLLLATKSVDKAEGDVVRAATLRVYHVSGLDGEPKQMLTPLKDPGVTDCDVEFSLDFVPGSIQVSDTDGDGYGEASVGWSSLCAGDPSPQRIKLALVTKGTYFILRGVGVRATDPPPPGGITFPKASFVPNQPSSKWPRGSYDATVDLFRTLFR